MKLYVYVIRRLLLAIPVVDEENKLVGVITVDDVIDVIKDEATLQQGFVSVGHVIPAVSLLRAGFRPLLPYGVRGGVIQNPCQEARKGRRLPDVERECGPPGDLFVLRGRVVAHDAPIAHRLDESGVRPADLGRLDVHGRVRDVASVAARRTAHRRARSAGSVVGDPAVPPAAPPRRPTRRRWRRQPDRFLGRCARGRRQHHE